MARPPDDPSSEEPPADDWDRDAWASDAWKQDAWKKDDWGKPAAPPRDGTVGPKKRGLAAYNAGMVEAGPYLTLGLQIAFAMAFFVGLGYAVDRWLGSVPWGMIAGATLGMIAVFTLIIQMARQADAAQRARREAKAGGEASTKTR